jgi:glycosyltransferase involved in cell wall biosynthesis
MRDGSRRLRVLTWHVHGNYLWYLSQAPHDFYVPFRTGRLHPFGGRAGTFPWPDNLHELPAERVRRSEFDCVLFQSRRNYLVDQHEMLSPAQRRLPRIFLELDPPLEHPFAEQHLVNDPDVLLVHVSHWNALMWDPGATPTRVIEEGVIVPDDARYTGELARGITAVNHLRGRGRRRGADLFLLARERVPIDLVGMDAESLGGLGEIDPPRLAYTQSRYRFWFSPIRQTSLQLAILEAMMVGVPIVGFRTGELASVIEDGVNGVLGLTLDGLVDTMQRLIRDPAEARRLGEGARRTALERFSIDRFARDWDAVLTDVAGRRRPSIRPRHAASTPAATASGCRG